MNKKTVHRAFTVLLCLITVFVMIMAVTPLSFADFTVSRIPYNLPIDNKFPYVTSYFFGSNSAIVDCKMNSGSWRRYIFNNNYTCVNIEATTSSGSTYYWISFYQNDSQDSTFSKPYYYYDIGTSYSSSFSSSNWVVAQLPTMASPQSARLYFTIYVNSCNCPINTGLGSAVLTHCDFNSYYPFIKSSGSDNRIQSVIDNQNAESSANESRYNAQQSEANSRQSQIMSEGSNITVSTIDNWVGGQNGLAAKMTNLAATLSVNADRFSSNQAQVSAQLSSAGAIISNAFGKFPSVIVACMFCFLIILIAVKVVGR